MIVSTAEMTNIQQLFQSEDLNYIRQGIHLITVLCDTEEDFRAFLFAITNVQLPKIPTLENIEIMFSSYPQNIQSYLSIWVLGCLAKWNAVLQKRTTELGLIYGGLKELPDSIEYLKELEEVTLEGNRFTEIPQILTSLPKLKILDLDENNITEIPDWIGGLSGLEEMYIQCNQIERISDNIEQLINLQQLLLDENHLLSLPDTIGKLSALHTLFLQSNRISQLPDSIGDISTLSELYLSVNYLSRLPDSIGKLHNLLHLDCHSNKIKTFPKQVTWPKLTSIHLSVNGLSVIPEALCSVPTLQYLNISDNTIREIPTWIIDCQELERFSIHTNPIQNYPQNLRHIEINKEQWQQYSSQITENNSLQSLEMKNQYLSKFPENIDRLTQLRSLNLSWNRLEKLPKTIAKLKLLKKLDISDNQFTNVPKVLIKLENLTHLNISNEHILLFSWLHDPTKQANLSRLINTLFQIPKLEYFVVEGITLSMTDMRENWQKYLTQRNSKKENNKGN